MGEIIVGGVYRHYKGNNYKVLAIATHTETLETMVVYKALYGEGKIWIRPATMWNEPVTLENGNTVHRFTYIEKEVEEC